VSSRWFLCFTLLLGLPACRSRKVESKLEVGIIAPAFNYLPLKVAETDGRLKGLGVSYQRFNSGWELGEALVAGKLDVAIIPFTYVVTAVARGSDIRIVACLEHEDDGIIARPGIKQLEDLDGRAIGCLKASTIELLLRRTLDARGIKARIVYFSSPMEMWSALERGDVDALSYYVPGIIKADGKIGRILHWYSNAWAMHPCCDIAVHTGRIRNKWPAVRQLIAAIEAGSHSIARDTVRACYIAVQTWGLTDSVALQSLRHTPFRVSLTEQETAFELNTATLMNQLGYIPKMVNPDQLYLKGFTAREE
jgi:ABC-type nitrate/sulfonate/bicarbonate transport system substrate-binding protein